MPKRKLLIAALLIFFFAVYGQEYSDLSVLFLQNETVSEKDFEQSIENIELENWPDNDTLVNYNAWLLNDKALLLLNSSSFFKTHYFIQLALSNEALENYSQAYDNIDSALFYINHLEHPQAYFHVLKLGKSISFNNLDSTTGIRFLTQIIDSKVIDADPVEKGEVLLTLAGVLENMHRYIESEKYCNEAIELYRQTDDDAKMIKVLKIMYNNTFHTTEDDSNWEYLHRALEIAEKSGDSLLFADVYSSFGLAHYRHGDQLEAIRYYKMARSLLSKKGTYNELWAATHQHLSYTLIDSVESACELSKYLLEQCLKNNSGILSNAYRGRAWCFAKREIRDSASYYLEKAAMEREAGEKADASPGFYFYMHEIAVLVENYELALKYLNTSLLQFRKYQREAKAVELASLRTQFDYDLQKERIKKLRLSSQLEQEKINRQRVIIASVIVLLIVALLFIYLRHKNVQRLNSAYKSLVVKNLELDKINVNLKKLEKKKNGKRNGLNIKDEEKIYAQLKNLLEEEKVFKQNDLSESKLAELLKTNNSYLSSIINNRFGVPFKTLLNKFRTDEARKMLVSKNFSNYSIEGIANEVGYQSRSAFYQVFKQNTGMTPSAYVKTYRQIDK